MNCKNCGEPLNESQYNKAHTKKSCPNCSKKNGQEHVFYDYPEAFGNTPLRSSKNIPDGAQSYCIACRGNQKPTLFEELCTNV